MGKKSSDPVPARQTAIAQTGSNIQTALGNTHLNNVDRYDPNGSIRVRQTGSAIVSDPYNGMSYKVPKFAEYTSLSPQQSAIKEYQDKAKLQLAKLASEESQYLDSFVKDRASFGTQALASSVSFQKPVTFTPVSPERNEPPVDFSQDREKIEKALFERLRPQEDLDKERLESRLASQGIRLGSEAYRDAMDVHERSLNDLRLAAILSAGKEHQRLVEMDRSEHQNRLDNEMRSTEFNNRLALQGQELKERLLRQDMALKNDSLNRIETILRTSQPEMPQYRQRSMGSIAGTDVAGIHADYEHANQRAWDGNKGFISNMVGHYVKSDRRLKTAIAPVGKTHDGQTIYRFRYKAGGPIQMGLMADEVTRKYPNAVIRWRGMQLVDYGAALQKAIRRKPVSRRADPLGLRPTPIR